MKVKHDPAWLVACGVRLAATREVLNMKQADLVRRTNVSTGALNHYETGKRPISIAYALELCDKFKITLDWLYRGDMSGLPHNLAVQLDLKMKALGRRAA